MKRERGEGEFDKEIPPLLRVLYFLLHCLNIHKNSSVALELGILLLIHVLKIHKELAWKSTEREDGIPQKKGRKKNGNPQIWMEIHDHI